MLKKTSSYLYVLPLLLYAVTAFPQEHIPAAKNIFDTVENDTTKGLWTFKKTELLRINVVKMLGETKMHKHPDAEHTILLVKGAMIAEVNGSKIDLKEGDILSIPVGMPHKYYVKGKKAIIVSMDAPYYDPGKTVMLEK